jgi:Xaa-Pro aminopeptidase
VIAVDVGALAPMPVAGRADRVRARLAEHGCDGLLVTDLLNIRWLTGFTGSAARLLVLPDDLVFLTDGRYQDQAAAELGAAGVGAQLGIGRTQEAQRALLEAALGGVRRLGLEAAAVTWADQRGYASWFPNDLVPTSGVIEGLRLVKDGGEIARIQAAADIAGDALAEVLALLDAEPTEAEFALEHDTAMRRRGADGPSFDTIVGAGPNGALPHHRPDGTRVREGDLVVIDFGATVDGYRSDMTRTAMLGEPSAQQAELIELVTAAEAAGVAVVAAGVAAADIDRACRELITAAGWGDHFTHGTGHGVGLRIHEAPWINATSTDVVSEGNVLTVEPGVYLGPLGGVRVEDAVLVTSDGCRPLTTTPKDLACLRSPRTT